MKKTIYLMAIIATVFACTSEPKDYVTLSGKLTNKKADSILVLNPQNRYQKVKALRLDEEGVFSDTLKVATGIYMLTHGDEYVQLFLKNGVAINLTLDTDKFDETLTFTGEGIDESEFLAKTNLDQEAFLKDINTILMLPQEEYDAKMNEYFDGVNARLSAVLLDSSFVVAQKQNMEMVRMQLGRMRVQKMEMAAKLPEGAASPKFVNYENYKGGTTSLDDLKGKYVYIDVWATWCGPCKREIPFLKKVEKQYHDKNIEFVSISIDEEKDHDAWKKMVTDKEMGGIQLLADNAWFSQFVKDYFIKGIPRFILIDPDGNIVNPDAPRPSSSSLIDLFNSLNI